MKFNYLIVFLSTIFISGASYGEVANTDRFIGGEKVYSFTKLDSTHENYHCETEGRGRVIFYLHSEIASGFDVRGVLKAHTDELKKYYFDAFHDQRVERASIKGELWAIFPPQIKLKCLPGKGGRSQTFPAEYGGTYP